LCERPTSWFQDGVQHLMVFRQFASRRISYSKP
jgi:hypothetical protein